MAISEVSTKTHNFAIDSTGLREPKDNAGKAAKLSEGTEVSAAPSGLQQPTDFQNGFYRDQYEGMNRLNQERMRLERLSFEARHRADQASRFFGALSALLDKGFQTQMSIISKISR